MRRPCADQPCGALVEPPASRCSEHAKAASKARGTTKERGYDGDWERIRPQILARDGYICQVRLVCKGAVATEVDHVLTIEERPDLRLDPENLRASCKPCNIARRHKPASAA